MLRRAVAGAAAGLLLAGPLATLGAAGPEPFPCIGGAITPHPPGWYSIDAPDFPAGPQTVSAYAVEPQNPANLYVTNGISVMRSFDSGCAWAVSYTLPESGAPDDVTSGNAEILEIEVAADGTLYLPIQQQAAAGSRPRVLVSRDRGATWNSADGGVLAGAIGRLLDFDVTAGAPESAYVLVDVEKSDLGAVSVEAGQAVFSTSDAGRRWDVRTIFQSGTTISTPVVTVGIGGRGNLEQLTAHPTTPAEVWVYGEAGTFVSDAAATREYPLGATAALDISPDGALVLVYAHGAPGGHVSIDGGKNFTAFQPGAEISSVSAIGPAPPFIGVAGGLGRVFFQIQAPAGPALIDVSPVDRRPVSDARFAVVAGETFPRLYGHTSYSIEVLVAIDPPEPPEVEEVMTNLDEADLPDVPGVLKPRRERVVLRPGGKSTIPYELTARSSPTPVDVYFLIDISGSMQGTINGVRSAMQRIVDRLYGAGIDVHFGVGAFRSFNDPPAYDRMRDIGPVDDELRRALDGLHARGGGDETQMAALYESATGEGSYGVAPDRQMNFRDGSLRLAILVTDEPISQGGPHPSLGVVADALVGADVKQVGVAIQDPPLVGGPNYEQPGEPAAALQTVARGSGALAGPGGVDCDGEPGAEIAEGGPLVCLVPPNRSSESDLMADVVVHVVEAVQDIQDLRPKVGPAANIDAESPVVQAVSPGIFPERDLKQPLKLKFTVDVRCPKVKTKKEFPLSVRVDAPKLRLASASLKVVCKPPDAEPEEEPEPPPVLTAFVAPAAILPPPPRPPEIAAQPNPQPNPNPQANPQAQAGLAAQKQKEPQLAVAREAVAPEKAPARSGSDEYKMTARRERPGAPGGVFVLAAGALTSACAYVLAVQRAATARAWARRRR